MISSVFARPRALSPVLCRLSLAICCTLAWTVPALAQDGTPRHAAALFGEPKYDADFKQLDYVNVNAPKGGHFRAAVVGSFDSTNAHIIKGVSAAGIAMLYDSLMSRSLDEPATSYGLIAKSIAIAPDRSAVTFELRPEARWHDGKPITVDDVIWSFETLRDKGSPFYRTYYKSVREAYKSGHRRVTFSFKRKNDKELPMIMGDLPILPKHYWTDGKRDFSKTSLEKPLGSGPYKVRSIETGRRITYERVKDWWAKDLPIMRGKYNFDRITYDYYRDNGVAFQAFLSGAADFRQENVAKNWAQGYTHPRVRNGDIIRKSISHDLPTGMQGFIYNIRRPMFKDVRVREALNYAFDYEWSNKQLAFNAYKRSRSYFNNCYLASEDIPEGEERALLMRYKSRLPEELFTQPYKNPLNKGDGMIRDNLRHGLKLLEDAGWTLNDKGLLQNKKGNLFTFEILTDNPMFDRWLLPFARNLRRMGIIVRLRTIDPAQYQNRMTSYDFDMTITVIPQSLTPGNEQYTYWHSTQANVPGGNNIVGIQNPVVDYLVNRVIKARTEEDLIASTKALDRVLLWNHYVIPQWYSDQFRIAYASWLGAPAENPPYGLPVLETWWDNRLDSSSAKKPASTPAAAQPVLDDPAK
jgi:microcin C transport system substrate-binding protein